MTGPDFLAKIHRFVATVPKFALRRFWRIVLLGLSQA